MAHANPYLFNVHGMAMDTSDSHIQPGNHLRINPNPHLGLPRAPFVIERAIINNLKEIKKRRDVVFYDNKDNILSPPFDIQQGQIITARVPVRPGEVCAWAELQAVPANLLNTVESRPPVAVLPIDRRVAVPIEDVRIAMPRRGGLVLSDVMRDSVIRDRLNRNIRDLIPVVSKTLRVEAFVDTPQGLRSIGVRTQPRYAFSGPNIVELRVTGQGRVGGLHWVEANELPQTKFTPVDVVGLPHESGLRYISYTDAKNRAQSRVVRQAPKRTPLQEIANMSPPNNAPPYTTAKEVKRVESLTGNLEADLHSLITRTQDPALQIDTQKVKDQLNNGKELGEVKIKRLHRVLQSRIDPGCAAYSGFKWRDPDWVEPEDVMVIYRVTGIFHYDAPTPNDETPEIDIQERIFGWLLAAARNDATKRNKSQIIEWLASRIAQINGVNFKVEDTRRFQNKDDYFLLESYVYVDRNSVPDTAPPCQLAWTEDAGWLPAPAPKAIREIDLGLKAVLPGAVLAVKAHKTNNANNVRIVNQKNAGGFHMPIVLSSRIRMRIPNPDRPMNIQGYVTDRSAEADALNYGVAQQDCFGRWANYHKRSIAEGRRPRPPRPILHASYTPPSITEAATKGGEIRVRIAVPDESTLAPGANLLKEIELRQIDPTTNLETNPEIVIRSFIEAETNKIAMPPPLQPGVTQPVGITPPQYLIITYEGPQLAQASTARLKFTANWIDTAGQRSNRAQPLVLDIRDPRPPVQIGLPPELSYTPRPDVTGLAWVEHSWIRPNDMLDYGVYYSDENRLMDFLRADAAHTAIVTQINAAIDPAAKAQILRNNQSLFPDHLFERLREVMVSYDDASQIGFRHAVSGSLRLLNFYKITVEGEGGNKPPLTDVEMMVFAVPNADPPPQPTLLVKPSTPVDGENDYVIEAIISVPRGVTPGQTWRLRRSQVTSTNIPRMPIVETGILPAILTADEQSAIVRDDGPVKISATAKLRPWVRYNYVVEVQGPPAPGSGIPKSGGGTTPLIEGLWSSPSPAVSTILVPANPPDPIVTATISGVNHPDGRRNVRVNVTPPFPLTGGEFGAYRIQLDRVGAAGKTQTLLKLDASGTDMVTMDGALPDDPGEVIPVGTEYKLTLLDPLGRASAPLSLILA